MKFLQEVVSDDQGEDINLTPLIDVVFLLLIFFMVSTTFDESRGIKVKLPSASTTPVKESKEELSVSIAESGEIYLGQKKVILDQLGEALSSAVGENRDQMLVIRADKATKHGLVVQVMDRAKAAGIERLAVATAPGN